jgi:arylsulfatase A-like enzyme
MNRCTRARIPNRRGRTDRALGATPLLALLGLQLLLGCAERPRPNLLIIVSDTLRADALSCQGGAARTPNICALAERGVLFENAYSNASWTLPSSVAMFTGNHPSEYARRNRAGRGVGHSLGKWFFYVDESERLCAEALVDAGYEAVGFLENSLPLASNALQGFDVLQLDSLEGPDVESGELAVRLGLDIADERQRWLVPALRYLLSAGERRFALLQWIQDPHAVYDPPPQQLEQLDLDAAELPRPIDFYTRLGSREDPERGVLSLESYVARMSMYERVAVKSLYLAEVASVDQRVGLLLQALDRGGLRDDTLIVFTSDHGEGFGEHGLYLHANSFFSELVHVPLIIVGPGITSGKRVTESVSHVDLMPTLRELLGIDCLRGDARGRSFRSVLTGEGAPAPRGQYTVDARPEAGDALVEGSHKLISRVSGEELLFDLASDPGESRDLLDQQRDIAEAMRGHLHEIRVENVERRKANLELGNDRLLKDASETTLEQLRAIGYVQ